MASQLVRDWDVPGPPGGVGSNPSREGCSHCPSPEPARRVWASLRGDARLPGPDKAASGLARPGDRPLGACLPSRVLGCKAAGRWWPLGTPAKRSGSRQSRWPLGEWIRQNVVLETKGGGGQRLPDWKEIVSWLLPSCLVGATFIKTWS